MNAHHDPTPPSRGRIALIAATFILIAAAAVVVISTSGPPRPSTTPTPSANADSASRARTAPTASRTLVVTTGTEPQPSTADAPMHGLRIAGTIPARTTVATVLTDEDCAPDAAGVSHCRNTLRLPDGATLTVRHPHRMMDVPCMTPGEHVRVTRAA